MKNDIFYMKVKIKSLAEEARIIRKMERQVKEKGWHKEVEHPNRFLLPELHKHRTYDVAREQRATLLAYAYVRNKPVGEGNGIPWSVFFRAFNILKNFKFIPRMKTVESEDYINFYKWVSNQTYIRE